MEEPAQKLQKELFASRLAYATAQRSQVALSGELRESQQEVEALKRTLQRLQDDATELRTYKLKVEQLEGSLLAQKRESRLLQASRSVLDDEIDSLRQGNASKSREIASLQQARALQKSKIEDQAAQLMVLKNQLAELEEELAAAENDATAAREEMQHERAAHVKLNIAEEANALLAENQKLLQRLAETTAERDHLRSCANSQSLPQTPAQPKQPKHPSTHDAEAPGNGGTEEVTAGSASTPVEVSFNDVHTLNENELRTALQHCLRLQEQYKHARESLLSANRRESLEAERLRHDVDALASSLKDAEVCSNAWQAQCMCSLAQLERLKEMLGEGVQWVDEEIDHHTVDSSDAHHPAPEEHTAAAAGNGIPYSHLESRSTLQTHNPCKDCSKMQRLALKHAEEAAALDLQVRAMCAEQMRSTQMAGQIGRSTLPMLYSIESRLLELATES